MKLEVGDEVDQYSIVRELVLPLMSAFPDTPVTPLARIAAQVTGQDDEAAWVRLPELYEPAIRKFAEYQGGGSESEDVAQFKVIVCWGLTDRIIYGTIHGLWVRR